MAVQPINLVATVMLYFKLHLFIKNLYYLGELVSSDGFKFRETEYPGPNGIKYKSTQIRPADVSLIIPMHREVKIHNVMR